MLIFYKIIYLIKNIILNLNFKNIINILILKIKIIIKINNLSKVMYIYFSKTNILVFIFITSNFFCYLNIYILLVNKSFIFINKYTRYY